MDRGALWRNQESEEFRGQIVPKTEWYCFFYYCVWKGFMECDGIETLELLKKKS